MELKEYELYLTTNCPPALISNTNLVPKGMQFKYESCEEDSCHGGNCPWKHILVRMFKVLEEQGKTTHDGEEEPRTTTNTPNINMAVGFMQLTGAFPENITENNSLNIKAVPSINITCLLSLATDCLNLGTK